MGGAFVVCERLCKKPVNGLLTWEKALRGVRMAYNRMIGLVPVPGVVMARLFQAERDPWTGGLRRKAPG